MEKTTLFLCIYCAIIGTCLWLTLFLTLKKIVFRMENRYNLSVPFVVVDSVEKQSRKISSARNSDDPTDDSAIELSKDNNKASTYERF